MGTRAGLIAGASTGLAVGLIEGLTEETVEEAVGEKGDGKGGGGTLCGPSSVPERAGGLGSFDKGTGKGPATIRPPEKPAFCN